MPLRVRVRGLRRLGLVAIGSLPMARGRGRGTRMGRLSTACWKIGNGNGRCSARCKSIGFTNRRHASWHDRPLIEKYESSLLPGSSSAATRALGTPCWPVCLLPRAMLSAVRMRICRMISARSRRWSIGSPGAGMVSVFEHNPLNASTVHAPCVPVPSMNAVLIRAGHESATPAGGFRGASAIGFSSRMYCAACVLWNARSPTCPWALNTTSLLPHKGPEPAVFARLLSVGAVNTLVGLGVIYACKRLLVFGDILANASGYAVGVTIAFMLNRHWTFEHRGNLRVAVLRFRWLPGL
jgi:hypothetical protein